MWEDLKVNDKECCATCHFWRRENRTGGFECRNVDSDLVGKRTKPMYGCFKWTKEGEGRKVDICL